jgi:dihydropteroate synthase
MIYARPIAMQDAGRPKGALSLAGGWCWFDRVELLERGEPGRIVPVLDLPKDMLHRLTAPRPSFAGVSLDRPRLMGILNVTPDSFSDGGRFLDPEAALAQGGALLDQGADILDIGGESTRPGAVTVAEDDEIARVVPVIEHLRKGGMAAPISIDTRKAGVAGAALVAGADAVNDVSALGHDPGMAGVLGQAQVPVILMHAGGPPETMQDDPRYGDVLLDVYDALSARVAAAEAAGIARHRIVIDPGIGFGKTVAHNLMLIRGISLFHGLGLPVMLGASRKRFIGTIGGDVQERMPGSVAVALAGVGQGVQMLRVHDVAATKQALALWQAVWGAGT